MSDMENTTTEQITEETSLSDTADTNLNEDRVVIFEEALEAILFAAGHPVSYSTLSRVFEISPAKIKEKVLEYSTIYNESLIPRGVIMLTFNDSCQLCTKQHYLTEIRNALGIKKSGSLSTSSMEALAIIAYNQPVTRAFVDTLRRVDSSYAMNNLIDRGLIEAKGRLDAPGRPMLYGTTQDFLRCFGIKDLSMLPGTTDELMEVFDKAKISAPCSDPSNEADASDIENEGIDSPNASQIQMELGDEPAQNGENPESIEPSADEDIIEDI